MHSVRRVRTSAEQKQARRRREAGEIRRFQALEKQVLSARDGDDPAAALRDTADLLEMDSDHYTAFNIRRRALVRLHNELLEQEKTDNANKNKKSQTEQQQEQLLEQELRLTEKLFPRNPKSYWIWNHRRWVLERMDLPHAWAREMALVGKLLEKDPRNFHGWGYRSWLVEREPRRQTHAEMLSFTTAKINHNFSNFSAWHYRAQSIMALACDLEAEGGGGGGGGGGADDDLEVFERPSLRSELDYVYEAVAMDPQDQSAWLYYRWLVHLPPAAAAAFGGAPLAESDLREIYGLVEELFTEEDSPWAGRFLAEISGLLHEPVSAAVISRLKELDPLRAQRYDDLCTATT